jgi:hypothetical protein
MIDVPTSEQVMTWLECLPEGYVLGRQTNDDGEVSSWNEVCLVGSALNAYNPGHTLSAGYASIYDEGQWRLSLPKPLGFLAIMFDEVTKGQAITAGELREKLAKYFLCSVIAHVASLEGYAE